MPRYLIVRELSEAALQDPASFSTRMKRVAAEKFPDISWEHSHVVSDGSMVKSFCVYSAPNTDLIRAHAEAVGDQVVDQTYEIAGDVSPGDFPG
jgi:Protein of unknown function (DUF4242)